MLFMFRKDGHQFSILDRGIPASRYLLAALIPAGGGLLVYLLNSLLFREPAFGDLTGLPWGLLLWVPLGAIGEELGWRGYLHKRLDIGLTGLVSSIVVGLLWALWQWDLSERCPLLSFPAPDDLVYGRHLRPGSGYRLQCPPRRHFPHDDQRHQSLFVQRHQ
jgi:membrane protease YdiL (CAAX protease family)